MARTSPKKSERDSLKPVPGSVPSSGSPVSNFYRLTFSFRPRSPHLHHWPPLQGLLDHGQRLPPPPRYEALPNQYSFLVRSSPPHEDSWLHQRSPRHSFVQHFLLKLLRWVYLPPGQQELRKDAREHEALLREQLKHCSRSLLFLCGRLQAHGLQQTVSCSSISLLLLFKSIKISLYSRPVPTQQLPVPQT